MRKTVQDSASVVCAGHFSLDLHNITTDKELRQRTSKPQSANLSNDETLNANMLAGILEVARF
jgi:hypothetical protein